MTYTEAFDDGTEYERLTPEDYEKLEGKRIIGHGKITGHTRCEGELHPSYVITDEGSYLTPEDLKHEKFDGRHNFIDF